MAFDPKQASTTATETMQSSMHGFAAASKAMQAVTNEIVSMSMDSLKHTTRAFEQMQGVKNWSDIMRIQTEFFKGSLEEFATRSRRIAELATAAPVDLANRTTDAADKVGAQTVAATEAVVDDAKAATVGLDG